YLVDLIVAEYFHLAAEQLCSAAVFDREHAAALSVGSEFGFGQQVKIVVAASHSEGNRFSDTRSQLDAHQPPRLALALLDAIQLYRNLFRSVLLVTKEL